MSDSTKGGTPPDGVVEQFPKNDLTAYHDFLKARGFSEADAARVGYRYLTREGVAKVLGYDVRSDAVALPYLDAENETILDRKVNPDGSRSMIDFTRLRLLKVEGAGKYRQPRGTTAHARLTPNANYAWTAVRHNSDLPLIFTEGEFKADLANTRRDVNGGPAWLPVVAFGGVTSWRARAGGAGMFVPELDGWFLAKREVLLAFDRDGNLPDGREYKREVEGALDALSAALNAAGARVKVLHIGRTETYRQACARAGGIQVKMGLDDFIVGGGTMAELLATAENSQIESELAMLLDRYACIGKTGDVIDLHTGTLLDFAAFERIYTNLLVETQGKNGINLTRVTRLWATSKRRKYLSHKGIWPNKPYGLLRLTEAEAATDRGEWVTRPSTDDEGMAWVFNVFMRATLLAGDEPLTDAELAQIEDWRLFVRAMMDGNGAEPTEFEMKGTDGLRWLGPDGTSGKDSAICGTFHDWVANTVQRPERRNTSCWVIASSEQGIGKSLLTDTIAAMHGESGMLVGPGVLGGRFNDYLHGKIIIACSELDDTREHIESVLKNLLTTPTLNIERKGRDIFTARNMTNILMSTNRSTAFRLTENGRREWVVAPQAKASDERWTTFIKERIVPLMLNPSPLVKWYALRDIGAYRPEQAAGLTDAKVEAAKASYSPAEAVAHIVMERIRELGIRAIKARTLNLAVQKASVDLNVPAPWMTVMKKIREIRSAGGDTFVVKEVGLIDTFSIRHKEFLELPPSERAKELDKGDMLGMVDFADSGQ